MTLSPTMLTKAAQPRIVADMWGYYHEWYPAIEAR
jgi:hypothetical protein